MNIGERTVKAENPQDAIKEFLGKNNPYKIIELVSIPKDKAGYSNCKVELQDGKKKSVGFYHIRLEEQKTVDIAMVCSGCPQVYRVHLLNVPKTEFFRWLDRGLVYADAEYSDEDTYKYLVGVYGPDEAKCIMKALGDYISEDPASAFDGVIDAFEDKKLIKTEFLDYDKNKKYDWFYKCGDDDDYEDI
jgi:hypothetical protein